MALVRLVEKSETSGDARAALDRGEQGWGQVLNTWKALANRPNIITAYLPFLGSVAGPGELDQRIKELTAVQVALDNHCLYTASHRSSSALKAGLTTDDLEALAAGDSSRFSDAERLALGLAKELTRTPTERRYDDAPQIVSQQMLDQLRDTFSDPELIELVLGIGVWNALARFHRTMGFELDMPDPPPGVREAL